MLFEHASGYAVFRCQEVEDIGSLLPEVQEAVLDFARFGSMLTLEAFSPFKTGVNALENINSISEGAKICYILVFKLYIIFIFCVHVYIMVTFVHRIYNGNICTPNK